VAPIPGEGDEVVERHNTVPEIVVWAAEAVAPGK
jgi:hypothetical protein